MGNLLRGRRSRAGSDESDKRPVSRVANSMQEVAPRIYMGSEKASKDLDSLRQNNITHIVAVGWDLDTHFPDDFQYLSLNKVLDRPQQIILNLFPQCFTFMDEALSGSGCIYVHCHKGLSRSASVIIGYIMYQKKQGFYETWQQVREKRSFIMPNIGFQEQMVAFEEHGWDLARDYNTVDVLDRVAKRIPKLLAEVRAAESLGEKGRLNELGEHELFDLTMHFHQVYQLNNDTGMAREDVAQLREAIERLRRIQVDFIANEQSIHHFDKLLFPKLPEFNPKYDARNLAIADAENELGAPSPMGRQISSGDESVGDEMDLKVDEDFERERSERSGGVTFALELPEDVDDFEKKEKNYVDVALRVSRSTKNLGIPVDFDFDDDDDSDGHDHSNK